MTYSEMSPEEKKKYMEETIKMIKKYDKLFLLMHEDN